MNSSTKPKILSLFSGCGGLDLGFHQSGFDIVACLEIDKPSCETMTANLGSHFSSTTKIHNKDITITEPAELGLSDVHFIIGGPPCQSFSAAGRRAGGVHGVNDTRGSLFWYYCKFVDFYRPKGFLFENVKGILQANNSSDWELVKSSFAELGYRLTFAVLDAADYGVPQHRERVILVGCRQDVGRDFKFPQPTHGPRGRITNSYVTPLMAFEDIHDPNEQKHKINGKYGELIPDIPPGMNYSYYTEKLGHPNPKFAWRSKFSGFLYKLPKDQPSKTIVANPGKYDGPFHWHNRKLTVPELQRIQSFPGDFVFPENTGQAIKQIGNSVAPKLAFELAKAVKLQFFGANDLDVVLEQATDERHNYLRKAEKAKITKKKTKKVVTIKNYQEDLFAEAREYTRTEILRTQFNRGDMVFACDGSLKDGVWDLKVNCTGKPSPFQTQLTLDFFNPDSCDFNKIVVRGKVPSPAHIATFWDAAHEAVKKSSSYDSLLPLYGHFTEPYPRFHATLDFNSGNDLSQFDSKVLSLLQNMTNADFLSKNHILRLISKNELEAKSVIRHLIEYGFDVRTHETNRAIKDGFFKPCYPFSLPASSNSSVKWVEKGEHKTGDLKINDLRMTR